MKAALVKRLQPSSGRPTPQECRAVVDALAGLHGRPNRHDHAAGLQPGCELKEPHTVLDSLVRTILSQNTTDITSQRAFTSLKQAFPAWEMVRSAPPGAVEAAIRVGGLADIKAARIKAILDSLLVERGELSLEHLRALPCDDIKQQLGRYKGVGPKSIACVMLFCLGRAECPVDTHVWEISKQLGWVPDTASREATYEHLNAIVPDEHKYSLHVLLVEHGKVCPHCAKRGSSNKRKGKAAAAAAVACPLAPFKRGSSAAATAAAAAGSPPASSASKALPAAAMDAPVLVKLEPELEQAAAAGAAVKVEGGSPLPAAAAAVAAPATAGGAIKVEQYAFTAVDGAVKHEEEQQGQEGQEQEDAAAPQPPPATARKRTRRR